jgi:hypothetical protein
MPRCTNTRNLELHHLTTEGGATLSNALVLCPSCGLHAVAHGPSGKALLSLAGHIREKALRRADYQEEKENGVVT